MFKKLLAIATAVVLGAGLSLVAVAAPASAHNASLSGTAVCQPDGTWTVTWTYNQMNTPSSGNGSQANVIVSATRSPAGSLVEGTAGQWYLNAQVGNENVNGQTSIPTRTGNWVQAFVQTGIAGTETSATVKVDTAWIGWGTGSLSKTVTLTGPCETPKTPVTVEGVPSATDPDCDTDGSLVIPAQTGIEWNYANGAGPGTYNLVASAADGYVLSAPYSTTVTVLPMTGDCPPPPKECLGPDSVSYTYSNTQNLGVVTVHADPNYPNVTLLCAPFWVTATSWTFILGDNVWPQKLDVVQKLPLISSVGEYAYTAPVTCGQGDIYAAWATGLDGDAAPNPPLQLNGPHNPWPEHFLHDMGFTGPAPTYLQHKAGACAEQIPGDPSSLPENCTAGVVSQGSITIVENLGKIQYTITGGVLVNPIVVVDGIPTTQLAAGLYMVTAHGINGFTVGVDNTWTYEITVLPAVNCKKIDIPVSNMTQSACVNNVPTGYYTLPATDFVEWWVDGALVTNPVAVIGNKVVNVVAKITAAGQALGIVFTDGTVEHAFPPHVFVAAENCDQPTLALLEPSAGMTPGSCTAAPTFWLSNTTSDHGGVQWKMGDPQANTTAGVHQASWNTKVEVEATLVDPINDGYAPETKTEWEFNFGAKPAACGDLSTLALTGATGGFVLWISGAMLLLGGAGIYFARRRLATQK